MGIEPTEDASQRPPPVLKTGPVTRSGSATAAECIGFRRRAGKKKEHGTWRLALPNSFVPAFAGPSGGAVHASPDLARRRRYLFGGRRSGGGRGRGSDQS